jgi:hypothetical protein
MERIVHVPNSPNDPVPYRLVEDRVKSKLAKYGNVPVGYEVLPFVLETSGGFLPLAVKFLKKLVIFALGSWGYSGNFS